MIPSYGLTHIALRVKDPARSSRFYEQVFGTRIMYQSDDFIQVQTPHSKDIIVFEKSDLIGQGQSGIIHFGFRLVSPVNLQDAIADIHRAGGTIRETGEFVEGEPYVFFYDPDGYEIEIWYEKIPPELNGFN